MANSFVMVRLSVYRGFVYAVVLYSDGHYCGYNRIDNKKLFNRFVKEYNYIATPDGFPRNAIPELSQVHGGITYLSHSDGEFLTAGDWLGFDYAHIGDGFDFDAVEKFFGVEVANTARSNYIPDERERLVTPEIVEEECKFLIDKILKIQEAENMKDEKITVSLTKEQFHLLNIVLDEHSSLCDAFYDDESGKLNTYDSEGNAISITPQEYFDTRLDENTFEI